MGSRQDTLASPAETAGLRQRAAPAAHHGMPSPVAALALIAGLTLAKLLLYVLAAQSFGSAERGLCQWDCEWYVHTIQHGYDLEPPLMRTQDLARADQANWAFFPLFPLLAGALKLTMGLDAFWASTTVSVLCFVGFALLSLRYRALTRGP